MTNEPLNGKTTHFWIILIVAIGLGGAGTLSGSDAVSQVEKLIDKLDETLQREMRLLTAPIDVRVLELGEDQDNMRDRINTIESEVSALKAQMAITLKP